MKHCVGAADLVTTTTVSAKALSAGAEGSVEVEVSQMPGAMDSWAMDERLWMGGNTPVSVTHAVGV